MNYKAILSARFIGKILVLFLICIVSLALLSFTSSDKISSTATTTIKSSAPSSKLYEENMVFENFNNVTGVNRFIVPNIIHFIHFNKSQLDFVDYVVLKAAMRNHRPDNFFIHTNTPETPLTGKYWNWIRNDTELWSRIKVKYLEAPTEIFGQNLSIGWRYHHGSDIGRIRVLMKYGGIYLDNDVFVIKNLDKYRKFEFVLNWEEEQFLGTQVLLAHKDARFLREWLNTYREYHSNKWYYNAGERPTTEVLFRHPELVHRVKGGFGAATGVSMSLYENYNFYWRKLYTVHLLMNHRSYLDSNYNSTPTFNETNIRSYKYPFGEMIMLSLCSLFKEIH